MTAFRTEPLRDIIAAIASGARTIDVLDPDLHRVVTVRPGLAYA